MELDQFMQQIQSIAAVLCFTLSLCAHPAETLPRPLKTSTDSLPALCPVVEAEEDVYSFEPANNGAGPMWCSGSTCLVRIADDVFASGLETLKDAKPLNN